MNDLKREKEILNISINDIIPNRFQPRLSFDDTSMQELAQSIIEHGIIQPLVVRRVADKYEIIAGERRYKAATIAAVATVPVIVVDLNDTESAEVALIENIQRRDLSPIEEAKSYQKIVEMGQTTQETLAQRMGKSQSTVANKIRLLSLSKPVQEALMNGEISERHARSLLSLKEETDQINMLNRIINERLTVRKTDTAIEEFTGKTIVEPDITVDHSMVESLDINPPTSVLMQSSVMPLNQTTPKVEPIKPNIDFLLKSDDELKENPVSADAIPALPSSTDPNLISTPIDFSIPALPNAYDMENLGIKNINNDPMLKPELPSQAEVPTNMVNNPSIMGSDYKSAINIIRETIKNLQKYDTKIESEEFDFENFFQINIKLDKN